jgi:hypothetical protein
MVRDNPLRISAIRQCQRIPASRCRCPLSPEILADIRPYRREKKKKHKNKQNKGLNKKHSFLLRAAQIPCLGMFFLINFLPLLFQVFLKF